MDTGPDDIIKVALGRLGVTPEGDALRAVDDLLRREKALASKLVDHLLPSLARAENDAAAARPHVAAGSAYLALGDAARAKELLLEGLSHLPADDAEGAARGTLRLAAAEIALGSRQGGRAHLARALASIVGLEDDGILGELSTALRASGDPTAAELVEHLRRAGTSGGDGRSAARLEIAARIVRALNSSLVGTAEPLHAILRAVLDESGAQRGFLMLYDEAALRFELGLARDGRVLGHGDFKYSTTIVARALEEGSCVLVPDLWKELPYSEATSANELGIRSALCVPLHVSRKRQGATLDTTLPTVKGIAGVLYVDSVAAATFSARDVRFFEILADAAAVAVKATRMATALRAYRAAEAEEQKTRGRRARSLPPSLGQELVPLDHPYDEFVTRDPLMRQTLKLLDRVVGSEANVVVRGESGTGKELVARALHRYGRRSKGPFVAIDSGAVPDELVQAELFGHESHAFTGAGEARAGILERAHGGTLLLDEVGEMSPAMQGALLRVLQEGEVRRLGGDRARPFDVRIVCATNRDLRAMVERGDFRHDLFFRLAVVEVRLPPLRERRGDVGVLVEHFLGEMAKRGGTKKLVVEPLALARLEEHGWPGNVRELENVLQALSLVCGEAITLADVDHVLGGQPVAKLPERTDARGAPVGPALAGTLEEIEQQVIADRLEKFGWNQIQAAETLGIDRRTLYRKIRRFGLRRGRA